MENKFGKPFYELLSNLNCSGIIYANDIPIFKFLGEETKEGIMEVQLPINHIVLQSGKCQIRGKMLPRYGQKALTENDGINISFNLCDFDHWRETKHSFFPEIHSPDAYFDKNNKITSPVNGLPLFEIVTEIEIELPFILDGWQKSIDLGKMYKDRELTLKKEIFTYYKKIHSILTEHNAAKFLELSKEKEELQTQAFYFDHNKKQEVRQSIINLFNENLEVLSLNQDELKLEIMGYGKLVSLLRLDGSPALQFKSLNSKKETNVVLDIKLHKRTANNDFSII